MSTGWQLERLTPVHQGESLRLGLRNLYIVPTRFGWLWLLAGLLQMLVAIQTQQNGPLLLGYLLLGLMLLALLLTQFNLQGMQLRGHPAAPGFAGSPCSYSLILHSSVRRDGLCLQWHGKTDTQDITFTVLPGEQQLTLSWIPTRRGLQRPGCLRLSSSAPLGLFHCWTRWQPEQRQLIFPRRLHGPVQQRPATSPCQQSLECSGDQANGVESWRDLRPHRPEDGAYRLAWKQLAQGRGRLSKVFNEANSPPLWLAPARGLPIEQALEHLSECIWNLSQEHRRFGLELPGLLISPSNGLAHRDRCLKALAIWR